MDKGGAKAERGYPGPTWGWVRLVMVAGICRRCLLSSVTLNGGPAGGFNHAGHSMTSCHLQSNYSSMAARRASSVTSH